MSVRSTKVGYVYLIGEEGTYLVKVGYTRTSDSNRLADLQGGNPRKLTRLAIRSGLWFEEQAWHRLLSSKHKRMSGEWFDLESDANVRRLSDTIARDKWGELLEDRRLLFDVGGYVNLLRGTP